MTIFITNIIRLISLIILLTNCTFAYTNLNNDFQYRLEMCRIRENSKTKTYLKDELKQKSIYNKCYIEVKNWQNARHKSN